MADFVAPRTITPAQPMPHTRYMGLSGSGLRTAIGVTAGFCFVAFGYGQGDIGGLMIMKTFNREFPQIDTVTEVPTIAKATLTGLVTAIWNLGCFVGAILTIFFGDLLGRKGSITLGLVVMTIGKIVQVSAFGLGQYAAGRAIAGIGNGFIASTVPAWQAECLKTHRRGTLLLVSFGCCITFGITMAYWIDYGFSWVTNQQTSWRTPVGLGIVPMFIPLALILFMPESPRYLVLNGREEEAKNVISALNELSPEDPDVHREFLMIKNTLLHMSGGGVLEAFKMGKYRYVHRTFLAVLLQVMQQWTGVNLFVQYLGTMFSNQLHFPAKEALLLAGCCSTWLFLSSLVAVVGIDRFWGRRSLTMFGAAGMCVCMSVLGAMSHRGIAEMGRDGAAATGKRSTTGMQHTSRTPYYVMTAFLFLYCFCFAVGWQGMSWLWAVELIPLRTRGPANALATAANWLSNFTVVLVTATLFTNITYKTYVLFAVTNFCIVPTIYFLYPETGYRSLEEVDVLFSEASKAGHPWLSVVKTARREPLWFDKNGDRSDSHTSDVGGMVTDSEKAKHDSSGSSEATRWKSHCRERERMTPSNSLDDGDAASAASPPPPIKKHRTKLAALGPAVG